MAVDLKKMMQELAASGKVPSRAAPVQSSALPKTKQTASKKTAPPPPPPIPTPVISSPLDEYKEMTAHISEPWKKSMFAKLGLKSIDDVLKDPSITMQQKAALIRSYGPTISGAFDQSMQAKVYDRQWPEAEEMKSVLEDASQTPTYGEDIVSGAIQGLGQQIEKMRTAPRDGVDLRLLGEALRTAGSTADMSAMPRGESQMDRDMLLLNLYQKLGDIGNKAASIDIDKLKALKVQPDVFTRGAIDRVGTQPPPKPTGAGDATKLRVKYGEALNKSGVPQLSQALEDLNNLIPGGILGWKGEPIPGFTPTDKGFRAINAQGLNSPEAQRLARAAQAVLNTIIAAQSGKAVSAQEAQRLADQLGSGTFNTQEQFISAMKQVNDMLERGVANLQATYGREAVDAYNREGRTSPTPRLTQPGSQTTAPQQPGAKVDLLNRMQSEKKR